MSAFSGTASFYARYRPGVPTEVADILDHAAPQTATGRPRRLLDLGSGPGLMARAISHAFDDIIAVDTDREMLAAAEALLRPTTPPRVRLALRQHAAETFTPPTNWQPHLVTVCRAFHWLDGPALLQHLSHLVAPGGVIAVLSDRSLWTNPSPWQEAVRRVVQRFLGAEGRAGTGAFPTVQQPHEHTLRNSPFSQVSRLRVPVQRLWTAE